MKIHDDEDTRDVSKGMKKVKVKIGHVFHRFQQVMHEDRYNIPSAPHMLPDSPYHGASPMQIQGRGEQYGSSPMGPPNPMLTPNKVLHAKLLQLL